MGLPCCAFRNLPLASIAKSAFVASVAVGGLTAGQAWALVVTVPGYGNWNVTTFLGSYDDNTTHFAQPPAPGAMPWWGSQVAAEAFANAVGDRLTPSTNICELCEPPSASGPYFGYGFDVETNYIRPVQYSSFEYTLSDPESGQAMSSITRGSIPFVWAEATAVAVPGPLPVLGIAACFVYSRKLRSRIKKSGNAATCTYTL